MLKTLAALATQALLTSFGMIGVLANSPKPPSYSRQATEIWENFWDGERPVHTVEMPSPDGKKSVSAAYDEQRMLTLLTVSVGAKRFVVNLGQGVGAELAWSPDSEAFFVTFSDAGLNGGYHTSIFYVHETGLRKINPDLVIQRVFGHPVECDYPEPPNVVGVAWLGSSHRVLIAAQIINHSICDSYGTFKAYEVSLPEVTVVKPYGQLATKKRFWSELGEELRSARDNCITDPKTCYTPVRQIQPK
jgi:hypothetical protein